MDSDNFQELRNLCNQANLACEETLSTHTIIMNSLLRNGVQTIDDFKRTSISEFESFRTIGNRRMRVIHKMRELLGFENTYIPDKPSETIRWNYISKVGLPSKDKYDWVLIKTDYLEGAALPHIAELRDGKWYATDVDRFGVESGDIESILGCKVIAWADMQLIK